MAQSYIYDLEINRFLNQIIVLIQNGGYSPEQQEEASHVISTKVYAALTYLEQEEQISFGAHMEWIVCLANLHDIGKLLVPLEILKKPEPLTHEEWCCIKQHSIWGKELVTQMTCRTSREREIRTLAENICLYHHERWDGQGYPYGLKRNEIPIEAQVVGMIDAYDALRSKRSYKEAMPNREAIKTILSGGCGQFAPTLLKALRVIADQY